MMQAEGSGMTAEQAGITPKFNPGSTNWKKMDAEFVSRLNRAYDAMPEDAKRDFNLESGYRSAATQAEIWERSGHGTRFAAAPPGRSYHSGGATDIGGAVDVKGGRARAWLQAHGHEYGLTGILGGMGGRDPGHIQMSHLPPGGERAFAQRAPGFGGTAPSGDAVGVIGTATEGGSPYLAQRRAALFSQLDNDPHTKAELGRLLATENWSKEPGAREAILERIVNASLRDGRSIKETMHSGFYGPINKPWTQRADDPAVTARAISTVRGGSNIIGLRTEQGMLKEHPYARQVGAERARLQNIMGEYFSDQSRASQEWSQKEARAMREYDEAARQRTQTEQTRQSFISSEPSGTAPEDRAAAGPTAPSNIFSRMLSEAIHPSPHPGEAAGPPRPFPMRRVEQGSALRAPFRERFGEWADKEGKTPTPRPRPHEADGDRPPPMHVTGSHIVGEVERARRDLQKPITVDMHVNHPSFSERARIGRARLRREHAVAMRQHKLESSGDQL
jgi:hypothetical protein